MPTLHCRSRFKTINFSLQILFKSDSSFLEQLGLNFINVLRTAFALVDPESVKNAVKSSVSFYSVGICARKSCATLMELTLGLNFINALYTAFFAYRSQKRKKTLMT